MDTTTIIGLASGCILAVVALLKVVNEISTRWDAREKRIAEGRVAEIANAVEVKRLLAETDEKSHKALVEYLWQIIENQKEEIQQLEGEGKLTRPMVKQIYAKLRDIRHNIEALKLTEDEVRPLKALLDETEELLP